MHSHQDTHQCPYHLHVVDHCLQQAKLVLSATPLALHTNTTPPTHTLPYIASLTRGGHTERWTHREGVCIPRVCRLCSAHWRGRKNCREKSMETCKQIKLHTWTHAYITLPTYVLLPTRTSWAERWSQFVQGQQWEVEEQLQWWEQYRVW